MVKYQSISINYFCKYLRSIITNQLLIDIDWTKLLTIQCYCTVLGIGEHSVVFQWNYDHKPFDTRTIKLLPDLSGDPRVTLMVTPEANPKTQNPI